MKPTKSELIEWLNAQMLCVISTIGQDGQPNAATVAFWQTDHLTFVIITDDSSRKAINIATDNRVAITVTGTDRRTMQLEGKARRLNPDEFEMYEQHYYAKMPFLLPLKSAPGQTSIAITPTHIRFTDITLRPWALTEFRFD
ncbi:MAG: pyridoxamine 5'-phosphate oxidase family protein [Candidatus Saccharimonadales bacterium]